MTGKVLLIDNYDSFVYNIYQSLSMLGCEVEVARNNQITIGQIKAGNYSAIVISPGPGSPDNESDFGICKKAILELGRTIPVLGICLGHQGIISAFGGKVSRAPKPMHGKTSLVAHNSKNIFEGIASPIRVMRYHSLAGEEGSIPDCLQIIATSDDGIIMAVAHKQFPIFGVQFHPESIMTEQGEKIFTNFLQKRGETNGH